MVYWGEQSLYRTCSLTGRRNVLKTKRASKNQPINQKFAGLWEKACRRKPTHNPAAPKKKPSIVVGNDNANNKGYTLAQFRH